MDTSIGQRNTRWRYRGSGEILLPAACSSALPGPAGIDHAVVLTKTERGEPARRIEDMTLRIDNASELPEHIRKLNGKKHPWVSNPWVFDYSLKEVKQCTGYY